MKNKNRIFLLLGLSLTIFSTSLIVIQMGIFKADISRVQDQVDQGIVVSKDQEAETDPLIGDTQDDGESLDYIDPAVETGDLSLDYIEPDQILNQEEGAQVGEKEDLDEEVDLENFTGSTNEDDQLTLDTSMDGIETDIEETEQVDQGDDIETFSGEIIDQNEEEQNSDNTDEQVEEDDNETADYSNIGTGSSGFTVVTEVINIEDINESEELTGDESSDIGSENLFNTSQQDELDDNQEIEGDIITDQINENDSSTNQGSETGDQNQNYNKEVYISDEVKNGISKQIEQDFIEYLDLFLSGDISEADLDLDESDFSVSGLDSLSHNVRTRLRKAKDEEIRKDKIIDDIEEEKRKLFSKFKNLQTQIYDIKEGKQINANYKDMDIGSEEFKKLGGAIALKKDADLDGLPDYIENIIDSNMLLIDTDGDGYSDYDEIRSLTNPNGKGDLYPDIYKNSGKASLIKKAISYGLSFVVAGANFGGDEIITRREAVKIVSSALFASDVISFNGDDSIFVYDDIVGDDEFMKYYKVGQSNNMFDGIIAYKFLPWGSFNRAEFIKMIVNGIGQPLSKNKYKWQDTEMKNWFTPYLSTAKDFGIINTSNISRFRPHDKITRYEAIKFSLKALEYKKNNK